MRNEMNIRFYRGRAGVLCRTPTKSAIEVPLGNKLTGNKMRVRFNDRNRRGIYSRPMHQGYINVPLRRKLERNERRRRIGYDNCWNVNRSVLPQRLQQVPNARPRLSGPLRVCLRYRRTEVLGYIQPQGTVQIPLRR